MRPFGNLHWAEKLRYSIISLAVQLAWIFILVYFQLLYLFFRDSKNYNWSGKYECTVVSMVRYYRKIAWLVTYIQNYNASKGSYDICIIYELYLQLKEARYKIIRNDRFSWKNRMRTYPYDDSKYTKIILGYHATFLPHAFESCMKFNFGPQICIHIWCDYLMSESLVYKANPQKLIL